MLPGKAARSESKSKSRATSQRQLLAAREQFLRLCALKNVFLRKHLMSAGHYLYSLKTVSTYDQLSNEVSIKSKQVSWLCLSNLLEILRNRCNIYCNILAINLTIYKMQLIFFKVFTLWFPHKSFLSFWFLFKRVWILIYIISSTTALNNNLN